MTVKVHIIYCGGCGYRPKFTKLKTLLEDEFPGELEITGEGTPSTTGWFEVEVNNKLVHSKKNGDGFVDSDSKFKAVVTAIEQAMGK
uniref:Selenoprotein W-like n=1 Tax=Sinocyclocheilus anshuiensis TaxID=1608454 RepID=A0A671P200_9TELE